MANAWKNADKKAVMAYNDGYMKYLDDCKTERLCVEVTEEMAKAQGYVDIATVSSLKAGDKVYKINRGKNIVLAKVGTASPEKGVNIVASHIDSPRFDLKQNPLYEDNGFALFETHHYGGVRPHQWVAMPLSLIGVVVTGDGKTVNVNIGEDEGDPVFTFTDLLPHLAGDQKGKKLIDAYPHENFDLLIGSMPHDDEDKNVKDVITELLKDKYGFEEEDFFSAELEIVPSIKARTVGLDGSMIGAYGQDDRVCAYASLQAIFELGDIATTAVCFLADKEETGSDGNTGMQSRFLENFIGELIEKVKGTCSDMDIRRAMSASSCLSGDVTSAYDVCYKNVFEKKNTAFLGNGIAMSKYTGSGGKGGTSDASAEFVGKIRRIFDSANVTWQAGELGKVAQGGGGTVAKYIAKLDVDVLDVGTPVLCMHAPFEITSKADTYMSYKGYKAFYEA